MAGLAAGAAGFTHAGATNAGKRPITDRSGHFTPDWESLGADYRAPRWFRDAKLGIWAHWGPQCVPEAGDWYARQMYIQGTPEADFHRRTYGHPADIGFLDIIGRWKAERWDPDRLMSLYEKAGARYFVALANHHDNFDTYASTHHPWNATRVGPKRDLVAGWAAAARGHGLRFGVSNHSSRAWHWFQSAYGYDAEGPRKGQRYDARTRTKADGRGTWWDGLDPRDLYTAPVMTMPDGIGSIAEANIHHSNTDVLWYGKETPANRAFARHWAIRCKQLINDYRPDLVYFDDVELPFDRLGLEIAADYYNANMAWHGGALEAVINGKLMPAEWRGALVEDVERGIKSFIETYPWQTCTCIGNWHYDRALYERDGYKSARTVIHILADVAAKNGNLLLSIPVRGDGSIDEKEERVLADLAGWMGRYGEAIHGTRPWRVHGEGIPVPGGGSFNESHDSRYGADDIRYMQRDETLHAIVLGYPANGVVRMSLLGADNPVGRGRIDRVRLFGEDAPLRFTRDTHALEVMIPERARNSVGFALAIDGKGLTTGLIQG